MLSALTATPAITGDADWDIHDSSYKSEIDFDTGTEYQAGFG